MQPQSAQQAETRPASKELDPNTISTTSAETRPASQELETTTRSYTNSHPERPPPIIVVATTPRHQTTIPRELTKALANKTRLHREHKGPLLNPRRRHAEVLVRRETSPMKMLQVESRWVSCTLQ